MTVLVVIVIAFYVVIFGTWIHSVHSSSKNDENTQNILASCSEDVKTAYSYFKNLEFDNDKYLKSKADFFVEFEVVIIEGHLIYSHDYKDNIQGITIVKIKQCLDFYVKEVSDTYVSGSHKEHDSSNDKSVIGRAIVGGVLTGGAGAVVGAVSALDKNIQNAGATKTVLDYSSRNIAAICYRTTDNPNKTYTVKLSHTPYSTELVNKIKEIKSKYSR